MSPDNNCSATSKTALFFIISDTDATFNFLVSMAYTQLFNLLCERADEKYGGRLFPEVIRLKSCTEVSKTCVLPKNLVGIGKPRTLSEVQLRH